MIDGTSWDIPVLQSSIVVLLPVVLFQSVLERGSVVIVFVSRQRWVGCVTHGQLKTLLRLVLGVEELGQLPDLAELPPSSGHVGLASYGLALNGAEVLRLNILYESFGALPLPLAHIDPAVDVSHLQGVPYESGWSLHWWAGVLFKHLGPLYGSVDVWLRLALGCHRDAA